MIYNYNDIMLLYSTKEFSEISKMVKNISLKDTDKFTVLNIKNLLSSSFCTEKKFKLIEIEFYLKLDKFENSIMSKVDLVRILINFYLSLKDKDQIAFYKKKIINVIIDTIIDKYDIEILKQRIKSWHSIKVKGKKEIRELKELVEINFFLLQIKSIQSSLPIEFHKWISLIDYMKSERI